MPRFRHMLMAALAVPVLLLGAVACGDDDNTAESDSSASAQSVDEINARIQRNEMVTALLGIGALPLHDIDETVNAGEEIPNNAVPSMRTLIRLVTVTEWDSDLKADADAIKASAEAFIAAAESDDHGATAEAATAVHEGWHDFSDGAWETVAPGAAPASDGGHAANETPHAEETPHDEETPEASALSPLIRFSAIAAAALICAMLGASNAQAHARYDDSTPAKGEVLSTSPSQVSITFTQEIQKVSGTYGIEVTNESDADVTTGDAVVSDADRTMMSVGLQPGLPNGRYVVQYKNVSDADGDPWAGGFAFYVGVEPTAEQLAADAQLEPEDEETPTPTEPAATTEPGETPAASATAVPPNGSDDDDGGGSTTWIIIVAVIAVGVVAGFVGARMFASRRRA